MPRTFAYVRVSTTGQTTENQLQEIGAAGFQVEPRRIVTETVSGSTAIAQRRGFSRLMDKLESGDILIVTKLDRLGRDAIDVSTTVRTLAEMNLLIERTQSGLKRAKSEGKTLGRPFTLNDEQKQGVRNDLAMGMSVSAIARKFATSRQTIMRVRDEGSRSVRP
ncbi:recombinase family protein [Rhizobium pusense]|uniref:recombinase family protein n=1 Tax=Agrobacterium pusense TaxID=648995 RepID=UPI000D19BEC0|nr:recombinase family protein [Agrobacterium pusense]HCJ74444.1 recombinase family protein [Agrobacterium sp.]MDH0912928.1 recombinase family protein [Agrobacterium pusense]MDH1099184.1 recombinase family protein [Agrobacterium pusense]MDH1115943.1 recombinase family protein [Agrobacterium pusense]MDH2197645.1 recombinase family protein [Agrobacterium pusense]